MKRLILYLLPYLFLSVACSNSKEKVLYPTKVMIGNTQYDFLYNPHSHNRIYCVTTTRPDSYAEFTYEYGDEYFHAPNHRWKNKIMRITNTPDRDIIGWDAIDSVYAVDRKENLLLRSKKTGLISKEDQSIWMFKPDVPDEGISRYKREIKDDLIRQTYNAENQLTKSVYYTMYHTKEQQDTVGVLTRKVAYTYSQGKLAKVSFYAADSSKPYLEIALAYDDKPGYLRNLPLEARFLPLELPYRDHNIVGYTVATP
jgi:hypothetical protein